MTAQKTTWQDPEETTVTSVEISSATTIYGTYSVIATIDATSDGAAKSSSNTWVVTYTDTAGTKSTWYKIRFYDSATTLWSEYSEPVTSEELLRLCTVADVKEIIDTVGRWTDTQIFKMITQVTDKKIGIKVSILGEINSPLCRSPYVGIHFIDLFIVKEFSLKFDFIC